MTHCAFIYFYVHFQTSVSSQIDRSHSFYHLDSDSSYFVFTIFAKQSTPVVYLHYYSFCNVGFQSVSALGGEGGQRPRAPQAPLFLVQVC